MLANFRMYSTRTGNYTRECAVVPRAWHPIQFGRSDTFRDRWSTFWWWTINCQCAFLTVYWYVSIWIHPGSSLNICLLPRRLWTSRGGVFELRQPRARSGGIWPSVLNQVKELEMGAYQLKVWNTALEGRMRSSECHDLISVERKVYLW